VSLRFRINVLITALMLLLLAAMAWMTINDTRSSLREEIEASTKVTIQLLTSVVYSSQFLPGGVLPNRIMLDFLKNLGRVRANEIRLYDGIGDLIYTSPPSKYKAGLYAPQWYADLVAPRPEHTTLRIRNGTLVIIPDPSRATLDAWDDFVKLGWIALAFFIMINALMFWLVGRWLRPIKVILGGLSEMERGRFDARLPDLTLPEFAAISHTFNRMADALEDSQAENRRLALLVKQSSDAIMIYDLQGNITFWNPAAERLFGYTAAQVDGKSATLLTPPERVAEIAQNLEGIARRELIENFETERVTSDGRVLEVALSAAPLIDPHDERVIGQICSMRDITENKRAQQTARELDENRKLTQLIQSHVEEERRHLARELHDELGQCVTAIKSIGYSIASRSKDGGSKDAAADIHENAQTIVSVASHIYDVVHGIIRDLRPSGLDHLGLLETLSDTVNTWRALHPEIEFDVRLQGKLDDLGETINITLYRLVQECLTNLVRHAAASEAEISLTRSDGSIKLMVADNGKGIGAGAAKNGHFGLIGMRERVQALHGSFETESRPGAGLRVIVVLPLEAAA